MKNKDISYDALLYLHKQELTTSCVVVGIRGDIYDVLDYIEDHPEIWGDYDSWEIITITKISPITQGIL